MWRVSGKPLDLGIAPAAPDAATSQEPPRAPMPPAPAPRLNPLKLEKMRREVAEAEARIAAIETELAALEAGLGNFRGNEEMQRLTVSIEEKRVELAAVTAQWEQLSLAVEQAS
jgi:hypothetical protein